MKQRNHFFITQEGFIYHRRFQSNCSWFNVQRRIWKKTKTKMFRITKFLFYNCRKYDVQKFAHAVCLVYLITPNDANPKSIFEQVLKKLSNQNTLLIAKQTLRYITMMEIVKYFIWMYSLF